jgi:dTDP-4-dehydrorhamnose reductase
MLGSVVRRESEPQMETFATVRSASIDQRAESGPDERLIFGVAVEDLASVTRAIDEAAPDVAINCIGIVKQSPLVADAPQLIQVNSLFPHQLAEACHARGVRLIHVSTDCVFSGRRGRYTEQDVPDPTDFYGQSKLAGEAFGDGVVTLRTSMIGREFRTKNGLLEWFLSQPAGSTVSGYTNAVFSGPTALELARAIVRVAADHAELEGTFHVGAEPISKHDLLLELRDAFGRDLRIEPCEEPVVDRSLDSSRFRAASGWDPPAWNRMVAELAATAGHESGQTANAAGG